MKQKSNAILVEDYSNISKTKYIPWNKLKGKTILVTGATGLIGSNIVNALLYKGNIKVIALARNEEKAKQKLFGNKNLKIITGNVEQLPVIEDSIDYIIHTAAPTASKYFVEHYDETVETIVEGTLNTLKLAKDKKVKGYIYLSSMEVYGSHTTDEPIYENTETNVDPLVVRNSYPHAKLIAEKLCIKYAKGSLVNTKIVRLAQTFGPGLEENDNRVFSEFLNCAKENKDIVLKTTGESKRCYLYTADAVTGILTVLLKGNTGEIYNVANMDTFCSIKQMAELVSHEIAKDKIKVIIENNDNSKYPATHSWNINSDKLKKLGWYPTRKLTDCFNRM